MVLSLPLSPILFFSSSSIAHFALYVNHLETKAQSNSPSRKGGVLLRSAFARGATKGVGGRQEEKFLFSLFFPFFSRRKKTYPRKRNKLLQSDDFSSLRLSVREKFWSSIKYVWKKVSGLYSAKSYFRNFYKMEFHF